MRAALIVAGAAMLAAPALTQGVPGVLFEAEVPFEFVVGGEVFEPGTYQIESSRREEDAPVLTIQRAKSRADGELAFVNVLTTPVKRSDPGKAPKLVFEKVGRLHFLEKVIPEEGTVRKVDE